MKEIKKERVEYSPDEMKMLWTLACSLLPANNYNLPKAMEAAIRMKLEFLGTSIHEGHPAGKDILRKAPTMAPFEGWYLEQGPESF